ncbi:unnamed protein product, partial [Strongylus vulgaris]
MARLALMVEVLEMAHLMGMAHPAPIVEIGEVLGMVLWMAHLVDMAHLVPMVEVLEMAHLAGMAPLAVPLSMVPRQ